MAPRIEAALGGCNASDQRATHFAKSGGLTVRECRNATMPMNLGPNFLYYFFFDCAIFYFMNYIEQEMPKAGDTVIVGMSGGID